VAYLSSGHRRYNQPFAPTNYGPQYVQGDVIGVGYRPRTGTIFFTRNGKKLEDIAHGLKSQNFFPTVGANGPCTVHVNFGQMGFVFIEANVKKWGLAPMTGSLAPPPPYGSEQGSILLEAGREGANISQRNEPGHSRSRSGITRIGFPTSPGPQRSPTDISLAHLTHIPSHEDSGEGASSVSRDESMAADDGPSEGQQPPEYTSPEGSRRSSDEEGERTPRVRASGRQPPIPTYDAAVGIARDAGFLDDIHER
jgi:SPRY domain